MRAAFLSLVIAAATVTSSAQDTSPELSVGQLIDIEPGDMIRGWTYTGGSDFAQRDWANYVTTETMECCTSVFDREDAILVARSVPVAKDYRGGILAKRVVEILKVDKLPGEFLVGCNLFWIEPAANLLNEETKVVRSFVVTRGGIEQISWINEREWCSWGDD
jgi:hypothetical protein